MIQIAVLTAALVCATSGFASAHPLIPGHLTEQQEELVAQGKLSEDYLPDDFEERRAMVERHPELQDCMAFRTCEPDDRNWHPKPLTPFGNDAGLAITRVIDGLELV
jgi:hypothetical protein